MKKYIMSPDGENEIQYIWESSKDIATFEKRIAGFYDRELRVFGELGLVQDYIDKKYGVRPPYKF